MSIPLWSAVLALITIVLILGLTVIFGRNEKEIMQRVRHLYSITDPQFLRSIDGLLGPTLVAGNRVETLLNGDEIFPAMLEAIRTAEKTITFQAYIYWSGNIGQQFVDALSGKARRGIKVHVLLDWFGSRRMAAERMAARTSSSVTCIPHRASDRNSPVEQPARSPVTNRRLSVFLRCIRSQ